MAWPEFVLVLGTSIVLLTTVAILFGNARWRSGTNKLRGRLERARLGGSRGNYHVSGLEGLPLPVQLYFRKVLKEGQPIIAAASVSHTGTFNMGESGEHWKPFTSSQRVTTQRPGFDWDAKVELVPGVGACVHDSYVAGEGSLRVALFGLVTIANLHGTPEMAQGELLRWFAEAAWYPTALLPSQGVLWDAVDDRSAKATLHDGPLTLSMLFRFGDDGLIKSIRAESRARIVNDQVSYAPWEGYFSNYELREGMLVPLDSEVAWMLPDGPRPYFRGRIGELKYEYAR